MSHKDYIAKCNRDQLRCLVEMANSRLAELCERRQVEYLVVGDEWTNEGFFEQRDWKAAIECFVKEATLQGERGTLDNLSINTVKYYPDELDGVLYKEKV